MDPRVRGGELPSPVGQYHLHQDEAAGQLIHARQRKWGGRQGTKRKRKAAHVLAVGALSTAKRGGEKEKGDRSTAPFLEMAQKASQSSRVRIPEELKPKMISWDGDVPIAARRRAEVVEFIV